MSQPTPRCRHRTRESAVRLALIALAFAMLCPAIAPRLAGAQAAGLQITALSAERWPALEVTATILDASGQPVDGLTQESFAGSVDGVAVPVSNLQSVSDPGVGIAVVLTFDVSGSMEGAPLENARAAARALVAQLGSSDQAAVIAFSDQPAVVQGFTADRSLLESAINSLAAGGNTSLHAAVQESVNLANSAPLPRRAVVLLSDGQDFGGLPVDPEVALASVRSGSAVFMSIGLGDATDQSYLAQLAAAGRGQYREAPTPEGLTALYQETAGVLRRQYVVTLDAGALDPVRAHGKTVRVQANVGGTVLSGEATLTLPPGLLATPAAPTTATEEPVPQPEPAARTSSGASPLRWALLGVAGAAVLGAAVAVTLRLRRIRAVSGEASLGRLEREERPMSYPTIERAVPDGPAGAWLETPEGRVPLGGAPLTIGFTPDCLVVLPNGTGTRTERARIWLREGSYMLHNLSRAGGITIAGRPVTWAVLEDGDEIEIGGQALIFRSAGSQPEI